MSPALRSKLKASGAAGAGALALAMIFGAHFEGTGPTRKGPDGTRQYKPYRDTGGIWTVCRGVTGKAVIPGRWYTEHDCQALESAAYQEAEAGARRLFVHYDTYSRWMQMSLIDMTYNVGEEKLRGMTIQRKLNAGDVVGGCEEMLRWNKGRVNGQLVPLPGLVLRRDASTEICRDWKD